MRNKLAMHWNKIAHDKHNCVMHWDCIAYYKHSCAMLWKHNLNASELNCLKST